MPGQLHFTDSPEANALIASDPMALLIGFALDQQVPVQKAFSGPLEIRERIGSLDPRANIAALPGFGEMKVKALGSVLAKRFGIEVAEGLIPAHPTLGDVDSAQALAEYQAAKRAHKAEWMKA